MALIEINKTKLAWLAGLFEGEGSLGKNGYQTSIQMRIAMTDEDVISRVYRFIGVGKIQGPYKQTNHQDHWKELWVWSLQTSEQVAELLLLLYPYLGERRRKQIRDLLKEWRDRPYKGSGARQRAQTHCSKGHPYNKENTYRYVSKEGWKLRRCRTCDHQRYMERRYGTR